MAGISVMLVGLVVCGRAGSLRKEDTNTIATTSSFSPFALGVFYCVTAGLLSALVNFALIFGAPIAKPAMTEGLDIATANNALWALVFTASYLVNFGYCIFKSYKENTFYKFRLISTAHYWLMAAMMGILWAGGIVVYGRGGDGRHLWSGVRLSKHARCVYLDGQCSRHDFWENGAALQLERDLL